MKPTITPYLTVSEIRTKIWAAVDSRGSGERSTPLLGQIFHEIVSQLIHSDSSHNLDVLLVEADADLEQWQAIVKQHVYRHLVYPQVQKNRSAFLQTSTELLKFWEAVQEAICWLCSLRWQWTQNGQQEKPLASWILSEQELRRTLTLPGTSTEVTLIGIADALILKPNGTSCVLELKLGQAAPEADLTQGCLYHLMQHGLIDNNSPQSTNSQGALAMIHFAPQKTETLFSAQDLQKAQKALLDLITEHCQMATPPSNPPRSTTATPPKAAASSALSQHNTLPLNGQYTPPKPRPAPTAPKPEETESIQELGKQIVSAFRQYGVSVSLAAEPVVGPTFIRFPLKLGRGTRLNKVKTLAPEIRISAGLAAEPFIHNPDHNLVIDVQRPDRQVVLMNQVLDQFPSHDLEQGSACAPVGIDLSGQLQWIDFSDSSTPHLLVAGTTGSGKSEWLIAAIAGLNRLNTPETLRYVLIDPKRNAFTWMQNSDFLQRPLVFPDEADVVEVFEQLVQEMERRYALFEGDSDLIAYRQRTGQQIPRLFCLCDEFFDLMAANSTQKKELERLLTRLGSKARAAGIHLILATQQPSRKVIDGAIDTTIPARVGLKTSKVTESRMLLSEKGAENLLGKGDLLFKDIGPARRLQGLYLPPEDRAFYAHSQPVDFQAVG